MSQIKWWHYNDIISIALILQPEKSDFMTSLLFGNLLLQILYNRSIWGRSWSVSTSSSTGNRLDKTLTLSYWGMTEYKFKMADLCIDFDFEAMLSRFQIVHSENSHRGGLPLFCSANQLFNLLFSPLCWSQFCSQISIFMCLQRIDFFQVYLLWKIVSKRHNAESAFSA